MRSRPAVSCEARTLHAPARSRVAKPEPFLYAEHMNLRPLPLALLLPTLALVSCAGGEPRGASSAPDEREGPTRRGPVMTLPPAWTPTTKATEVVVSQPTATDTSRPDPTPTPRLVVEPDDWPLLVYCDVPGQAGLLASTGEMLGSPWRGCFERGLISPAAGLAVAPGSIVRVHDGVVVRPVNGQADGWSADGSAFFTIAVEGDQIYRAAAEGGWALDVVEPQVAGQSELELVLGPGAPSLP